MEPSVILKRCRILMRAILLLSYLLSISIQPITELIIAMLLIDSSAPVDIPRSHFGSKQWYRSILEILYELLLGAAVVPFLSW
jgi:hypothetical protein